jgi:hypothetical protein
MLKKSNNVPKVKELVTKQEQLFIILLNFAIEFIPLISAKNSRTGHLRMWCQHNMLNRSIKTKDGMSKF